MNWNFCVKNCCTRQPIGKAKTQTKEIPTILVNGYRLPKQYTIEDLQYQTDAMIE